MRTEVGNPHQALAYLLCRDLVFAKAAAGLPESSLPATR